MIVPDAEYGRRIVSGTQNVFGYGLPHCKTYWETSKTMASSHSHLFQFIDISNHLIFVTLPLLFKKVVGPQIHLNYTTEISSLLNNSSYYDHDHTRAFNSMLP